LKTLILIIIGSICGTPPDPQTGAWGSHPEPSTHRAAATRPCQSGTVSGMNGLRLFRDGYAKSQGLPSPDRWAGKPDFAGQFGPPVASDRQLSSNRPDLMK